MAETGTKSDTYKPTKSEIKLLEVLVNPENMWLSVAEKCHLADISRNTYYKIMKKDQFISLLNKATMEIVKGSVADVINATYAFAMSSKGHQDRKMILQMAGLFSDKKEVELTGQVGLDLNTKKQVANEYMSKLLGDDLDE